MTTALDRLARLVPPQQPPRPHPEWSEVERVLGTRLPDDYKALVDLYGPGAFDGFLWILQPAETNEHLDLTAQRHARLEALRVLGRQGEAIPYQIDRGNEVLLPWAITDNGDVLYWVAEARGQPNEWSVVVNEARGPRWERFDGSATQFLEAVLAKSFVPSSFPSDFPSDHPTFEASKLTAQSL